MREFGLINVEKHGRAHFVVSMDNGRTPDLKCESNDNYIDFLSAGQRITFVFIFLVD